MQAKEDAPTSNFKAFAGGGQRLDGKNLKQTQAAKLEAMPVVPVEDKEAFGSAGITVAGSAAAARAAATTEPAPVHTTKFTPKPTKWGKTSKAAFTGGGNALSK